MTATPTGGSGEGSLAAPTRHALDWRNPSFYDEAALTKELERIFDICHGCRRCFSLCNAFPTLFDAIDATATGELASVDKKVFWEVVDHCYLCDMCFMTKCPYVPPHPWNVDFPHLMLRAKANRVQREGVGLRDRVLASTEAVGKLAGIPVVAEVVNAVNRSRPGRALLAATLGVHPDAPIPTYYSRSARKRLKGRVAAEPGLSGATSRAQTSVPNEASGAPNEASGAPSGASAAPSGASAAPPEVPAPPLASTRGRVALFTTCYGNRNEPQLLEDLVAIFEHNGIEVRLTAHERCCGMPWLELGDLQSVAQLKEENIPELKRLRDAGFDIVAPVPSCVLMFKQELPLMFPEDTDVQAVRARMFDPFEYLMLRHKAGLLRTDFKHALGKVSYHVPCHLRVQNIGLKTRDLLRLAPQTTVEVIERCSGHDGTYGVKRRFRAASERIGKPVAQRVANAKADHYCSDCPMAGEQIESLLAPDGAPASTQRHAEHPVRLLRFAYGI